MFAVCSVGISREEISHAEASSTIPDGARHSPMQKSYFAAVASQLLHDHARLLMFNAQFSGCLQGNQRRPGRGVLASGSNLTLGARA
jgi:hypothetical protein